MIQSKDDVLRSARARYRLTLLFTDIAGSTRLGRIMEPEDYADLMEKVRGIWGVAVDHHGGRIVRTQGDGALVIFGFPSSGEDDGRRAVEAALDIHDQVLALKIASLPQSMLPLQMHSGIHAGTVLLSEGDIERGRFDLTGDVANTAAHLSNFAQSGQILASIGALGPHENFFELDPPPLGAEAREPPTEYRAVLRRSGVRNRFDATARRGMTPFIGRGESMARIKKFLLHSNPMATANQRCLVVVGTAGLGKTRLLQEAISQHYLPSTSLLRGGCESYLGAEVLQPFAQMVRSFFGVSERLPMAALSANTLQLLNVWRNHLSGASESLMSLIASDADQSGKRVTTGGMVGDLLAFFTALAGQAPVLMLIDDWQWADDASLQLMGALLQIPSAPSIILASRPRAGGQDWIVGAEHLHLTPFVESETWLAVRRWLPHADPFLCSKIHSYSGGVPLFVEELCHSASADTLSKAMEDQGAVQSWLATLVASRVGRLPQILADFIRAAAVIGNHVPLWLMGAILARVPTREELDALAEADFLYPAETPGVLRFKHGITRDAVYQSIGLHERTALHKAVLVALSLASDGAESDEAVEALAHHSRGAGLWDQAAGFAERAGDKATAAFALDRGRAQYQFAMKALDRISQPTREQELRWCQLANKLGMICVFDPLALGNDLSVFERAVELSQDLGDLRVLARAKYLLAYICYSCGRFRESLLHIREALVLARQASEARLAVQIEATLGQVLAATCDYDNAIELINVAVDAKRQRSRPRGGLAMGSAYALACKGGIFADRGDFSLAHACFDEAIDLLDGSTHPVGNSVRNWIAVAYNWQGRWSEAKRVAADSLRIAENTRALLLLSAARSSAGYAAWAEDDSPIGLEQLGEAMRWMDERQGRFYTSIYFGWLVAASTAQAQFDSARGHAFKVFQRARQGERLGEAVACRSLAWAAIVGNHENAAARWMRRAETAATLRGSPREEALNQLVQGQIHRRLGQSQEAQELLNNVMAKFQRMGMSWHAAATHSMVADEGNHRVILT
jgi:tetratricopeptide (TPR) repeat protein